MKTLELTDQHRNAITQIIESAAGFRKAFGAPFSESLLAEAYVAQRLNLKLCLGNNAGFGAIGQDGQRYQIKHRAPGTQNVDINNFDFDQLVLVNLGIDLRPLGIWMVHRADIQAELTWRQKFRKHQTSQDNVKRLGKRLA